MNGYVIEITMADCDDQLHKVQVPTVKFDGQRLDLTEVEIWTMVLLWMFVLSFLVSLLCYFQTSLILQITVQYKWHRDEFLQLLEIS